MATSNTDLSTFPPELVDALYREAEVSAGRVDVFLDEFLGRIAPTMPKAAWRFPATFLLELGAALSLMAWERDGIDLHRRSGLPSADEAIRQVFNGLGRVAASEQWPPATRICAEVVRLFVEHFAWHGRAHLNAPILLGQAGEDELIEALALFLWSHRQDLPFEPE